MHTISGHSIKYPPEIIAMTKTYTFSGNYEIGDIEFFLHHGQLDRSIPPALPYADASSFEALDPENDCDLILFGHNHIQFTHNWETRLISIQVALANRGCGRTHACYAVFENGNYIPRQVIMTNDPGFRN